jgi:hypothetical protein
MLKCKSPDHIVADCPYNSDIEEDEKKKDKKEKEKKEKKMTFKKKKNESGYVVTWDSDGTNDSDNDSSSDDDRKAIKRALASVAMNDKPSDTPLICLMAKPTKIKYDTSDDECESDDCRSDDEEYTKEELMDMCEQVHICFEMKRKECKELRKELKALKQSLRELQASHECLKEDHEELDLTYTKLKKAHSSLVEQVKKEEAKEQVIVSYDVGLKYGIIDESFYKHIVVALTNPSCSTFTTTSSSGEGFTCDASLKVENETLKEVNELTRALGKAYGGEDRLLMCLGGQRPSLNKKGLGYTPKKGKTAFAPHKTSYVKNNGRYCTSCK